MFCTVSEKDDRFISLFVKRDDSIISESLWIIKINLLKKIILVKIYWKLMLWFVFML